MQRNGLSQLNENDDDFALYMRMISALAFVDPPYVPQAFYDLEAEIRNDYGQYNSISYHKLLKDEMTKIAWIHFLGRKELPKRGAVCGENFTEDCFDSSHDMKFKLMPGSTRVKKKIPSKRYFQQ